MFTNFGMMIRSAVTMPPSSSSASSSPCSASCVDLPEDVIQRIVSFVDMSTLVSCRQVRNRFMQQTFEKELLQRMETSSSTSSSTTSDEDEPTTSIKFQLKSSSTSSDKHGDDEESQQEEGLHFCIELRYMKDDTWTKEYTNHDTIIDTAIKTHYYCNPPPNSTSLSRFMNRVKPQLKSRGFIHKFDFMHTHEHREDNNDWCLYAKYEQHRGHDGNNASSGGGFGDSSSSCDENDNNDVSQYVKNLIYKDWINSFRKDYRYINFMSTRKSSKSNNGNNEGDDGEDCVDTIMASLVPPTSQPTKTSSLLQTLKQQRQQPKTPTQQRNEDDWNAFKHCIAYLILTKLSSTSLSHEDDGDTMDCSMSDDDISITSSMASSSSSSGSRSGSQMNYGHIKYNCHNPLFWYSGEDGCLQFEIDSKDDNKKKKIELVMTRCICD